MSSLMLAVMSRHVLETPDLSRRRAVVGWTRLEVGYEAAGGLLLHPSSVTRARTTNKCHIGPHPGEKQTLAGFGHLGDPWEGKILLVEGGR